MRTTRRSVLIAGAGGAGLAVLAACSSGGSAGEPANSSGGSAGEPASSAGGGSTPAGGSSAAGGGDVLATLADIKVGQCIAADLPDGGPGIVSRPTADTAKCFSAICTHQGCTVAPAGDKLNCPCHGSQYNALTGQVLQGPAPRPLEEIAVKVEDGKVVATA